MTTALLNLTGMGERPVEVERLATAIGRPLDETVALAQQWARVHVADGFIHFDPQGSPFSRYHVEVGTRVLDTGGCAPDLFWAVLAAGVSVRAESICPATGTAIRVDLSPVGVELVEPPGTVVTVLTRRWTMWTMPMPMCVHSSPSLPRLRRQRAGWLRTPEGESTWLKRSSSGSEEPLPW
jgi:hypothetical protein